MEERYGIDQVCSVGTYATLQVKAALKDLAKNRGVSFQEVRKLSNKLNMEKQSIENFLKIACSDRSVSLFINTYPEILDTIELIYGQPKNKSIHACAMMIYPSEKTMFEWAPISKQKGMMVSEWEGGELDAAGFLKEDILGIQQLDKLSDIISLIKENFNGKVINLYDIPKDDQKVFGYFQRGWTGDVFHFGAAGLTGYCKQLKPDNITDLINCIGLYRPGVMESNFHNEYILRKTGERYSEARVGAEEILRETQNVMIWQEQTMKMFQKLGGFDLVESDTARRSIGKKDVSKLLAFKERFIEHYMKNYGVDYGYAEETWGEIEHMSSYQFNKCVSGRMVILRGGRANKYKPTVEEMYKIAHSKEYAEATNHIALRQVYLSKGYGSGWSLNENGALVINRIKDIRYQGIRRTYKVTVEGGASISVTENHKFPTDKGELMLKDMKVGDSIPVNIGYHAEDTMYVFTDKGISNSKYHAQSESFREKYVLNSQKGAQGFVSKETSTSFTQLQYYKTYLMKDRCEQCDCSDKKLEVHHIDGCHGNNDFNNLQTVCVSCHKKLHYGMGRTKMGRKGLKTEFRRIISIEFDREESVYDIEMEHPYHTFAIDNGIVTCNSHAVCYALTGYACQWLKVHYPLEYWAVTFSYAKDDDYPIYLSEIGEMGVVSILTPDINESIDKIRMDMDKKKFYWPLSSVKQVGEKAIEEILRERNQSGPYFSLSDFIDRHNFKGSKVNKSVVENLILTGAFDGVENVTNLTSRLKLIHYYHDIKKIKQTEKSIFMDNPKVNFDWWYTLQQKILCGFAFFDYKKIYTQYSELFEDGISVGFKSVDEVDTLSSISRKEVVVVGGYVYDMAVKQSRKGMYCRLKLEQNYKFIDVLVWTEQYEDFEEILGECDGKILFVSGNLVWNDRDNSYSLHTSSFTKMALLT